MNVPKTIFRNYDIRGIIPDEINAEIMEMIGKALGTFIVRKQKSRIVVGRDDRKESPELSEAFIKGLVSTGCFVTDIGITITPVIHFLTCAQEFDYGAIVTASHNPKQFNGLRIDFKNAKPFYGDSILMLRFLIEQEAFETGDGNMVNKDLSEIYLKYLVGKFKFEKRLKVVLDCGGGACSELAPRIFSNFNLDLIPVNCNYDSNFPNGVPDPERRLFMEELSNEVVKNKADVGFAFDTDGDRFGVVDDKGVIYDTDKILLLFAEDILKKRPRAKIVFDVKSSLLDEKVIKELGGVPKLIRTGHPYFLKEVQNNALLGAEYSGHVYFSDDYYGYDDGVYAALRVLKILSNKNQSLNYLMSRYPTRFSTNELKVDCPDNIKFKVINEIKIYVMNFVDFLRIIDIDGVRVHISETGWFLVRASNTSPYLSIRVEGKDEEEKNYILNIVNETLANNSVQNLKLNL